MFMCSKGFLKIQLFHRYFKKILPKHSRMLTERSTPFSDTCLKFTGIFCEIVIIFLGRNTPNNTFLDVTNKATKKVMWHCCWSPSIMNIEQLIFTWKGQHLVLALFASIWIKHNKILENHSDFLWHANISVVFDLFLSWRLRTVCPNQSFRFKYKSLEVCTKWGIMKYHFQSLLWWHSLVVSNLLSETEGFLFKPGC